MILRLVIIRNERGVTLVATIILLFFISLFLFSMLMWHDSLYRNFNALETYYENRAIDYMNMMIEEVDFSIEENILSDYQELEVDLIEEEVSALEEDSTKVE